MEQYPNPSQNPYGQTPQSGQPAYSPPPAGYSPTPPLMPAPASPRKNGRIIAAVVAVVLILAIVGAGAYHVTSATGVVKNYYNDLFSYKFDAAFSLVCADKQAALKADFDATKNAVSLAQSAATFDASKLVYTLKNSGLTSADVTVSGSMTVHVILNGSTISTTSPVVGNTDTKSAASGLGWCIEGLTGTNPNTNTGS